MIIRIMLEKNVQEIKARITAAANGRAVKIVAATKTVNAERINLLPALGITAAGENRVQELLSKHDALIVPELHFIGALQTNKVKYIVDKVCMIQSLDRLELAFEIDKRCAAAGKIMPVLIEVNIGQEGSKSGCDESGVFKLIENVKQFNCIDVKGLMSVLPIGADGGLYDKMYELFIGSDKRFGGIDILSMGMSDDYEKAIIHGSNMVRIGSALFGERNYA